MRSTAIEPDHLLLGLLREDPALFQVITGRDSSVVSEIKEEVKSTARFELASAATDALPLSRLGQQAVKSAERLRREFDQKHAGTQHLLLAIAKLPGPPDSKIRLFFGKPGSSVPGLLRKYGITEQALTERIRVGDLTPQAAIQDALQLLKAQVSALAEILYGKNLLTIEDINRLIDSNSELLPVKTLLTLILEALVKKEIFSKEEAEEILKPS